MSHLDKKLQAPVFDFFREHLIDRDSSLQFTFRDDMGNREMEYWSNDIHMVPTTDGIWLAYKGFPAQVRHLFLSHSAADILCFCHYNSNWLTAEGNIAFAALGLVASSGQLHLLKDIFFNAKVHTLFEAGITGRVSDCKVALWLKNRDATFRLDGEDIHIGYHKSKFSIPAQLFSLNRFEKIAGIRSGIRTHKPKACYCSFYELFIASMGINPK